MQRLASHHLRYLPDKSDVLNSSLPEGMGGKKGSSGVGLLLSTGSAAGLGLGGAAVGATVGGGLEGSSAAIAGREGDGGDSGAGGEWMMERVVGKLVMNSPADGSCFPSATTPDD